MDPETAKTLVSAALVAGIGLFSFAAFRALLTQVAADLRAGRAERAMAPARARGSHPRAG